MIRLRKELLGLAPLWAVAFLLGIVPSFLRFSSNDDVRGLWLGVYGIGCALLATAVFGKEIAGGTLGFLLVQPIGRMRLLLEKVAPAFFGSLLLAVVCGGQWALRRSHSPDSIFLLLTAIMVPLCCFGPGIFLSLLLRQTIGAFWLTLLIPLFIMTLFSIAQSFLQIPERFESTTLIAILSLYGAAGAWLARRYFLRIQDSESQALTISVGLDMRGARASVRGAAPVRRAGRALLKKELSLQTFNFILAAALLVFYGILALLGDRLIVPGTNIPIGKELVLFCWFLLPFSIGALPIAWERRLGILAWQQVQPVSRFRQWLVKVAVAYLFSLLASFIMSVLLQIQEVPTFSTPGHEVALTIFLVIPASFITATTMSLYASSRASSYLMAMSLVFGLAIALVGLLMVGARWLGDLPTISPTPLLILLGFLCWCPILCWLSWKNYYAVHFDRWINRLNAIVVSCTLVAWFGTGAFLYNRTWEQLFRSEPKPGPSMAVDGVRPSINLYAGALAPDGSFWSMDWRGQFSPLRRVQDTNQWVEVDNAGSDVVALRADHSLWFFSAGWGVEYAHREPQLLSPSRSWTKFAVSNRYRTGNQTTQRCAAVDAEGNLWQWIRTFKSAREIGDFQAYKSEVPTEIRWKDIALAGDLTFAISEEGDCWAWGEMRSDVELAPTRIGSGEKWNRLKSRERGGHVLLEQADGSVWMAAPWMGNSRTLPLLSLGETHRWQSLTEVGFGGPGLVALRDDGTLWERTSFSSGWWREPTDNLDEKHFRKLSHRSDWVAVAMWGESAFALTADGTLWHWGRSAGDADPWLLPYSRVPRPIASLR